jgi:hypothetical protein
MRNGGVLWFFEENRLIKYYMRKKTVNDFSKAAAKIAQVLKDLEFLPDMSSSSSIIFVPLLQVCVSHYSVEYNLSPFQIPYYIYYT